jgi:uncharacterized protein YdeI (YjbR/CyaY-like superfamily)/alkylated DNA nucleotide flippase Atl1
MPKRTKSAAFERIKREVLAIVRAIPRGRVCTYGAIGDALDVMPRHVAYLLATLEPGLRDDVPWHRVVKDDGTVSDTDPARAREQIAMLKRERVGVDGLSVASFEEVFVMPDASAAGQAVIAPATTSRETRRGRASKSPHANPVPAYRERGQVGVARRETSAPRAEDALPHVHPRTRSKWRAWLAKHAATSGPIWLVYDKQSAGPRTLSYAEAVEEALCFGWVDSKVRPIDAKTYKQYFAPRKAKSTWSKVNKERVDRLVAAGLMTPAGQACVDRAKRDGSWTVLDAVEALTVPDDLAAALAANDAARRWFAEFKRGAKKILLYWVTTAKRPETRAARIAELVAAAAEGRVAYPREGMKREDAKTRRGSEEIQPQRAQRK